MCKNLFLHEKSQEINFIRRIFLNYFTFFFNAQVELFSSSIACHEKNRVPVSGNYYHNAFYFGPLLGYFHDQ